MGAWLSTKKVCSFSSQRQLSQKHRMLVGSGHGNVGHSFQPLHAKSEEPLGTWSLMSSGKGSNGTNTDQSQPLLQRMSRWSTAWENFHCFPALKAMFGIFVGKLYLIMASLVRNLSSGTVKQTCQIFIHMFSKHTPVFLWLVWSCDLGFSVFIYFSFNNVNILCWDNRVRVGRHGSFQMMRETQATSSRLGKLPAGSQGEFTQDMKRNLTEEIKGGLLLLPQTDRDYSRSKTNHG